jgi:hypothetical protein
MSSSQSGCGATPHKQQKFRTQDPLAAATSSQVLHNRGVGQRPTNNKNSELKIYFIETFW